MRTQRRAGASALVLLCGLAIVAGAFLPWVDARGPRPASGITHTSITGLFQWSYQVSAPFLRSFALVIIVCGALVAIGGLAASRLLASLFAVLTLTGAGLWIGLNASHYHAVDLPYSDLRTGAWLVIGGGLVGLIASFAMRRSRPA
jgi:hypothetical protein